MEKLGTMTRNELAPCDASFGAIGLAVLNEAKLNCLNHGRHTTESM